ncbi:MAG: isoaspartyl peptidase/L-asparaginase, partial [Bacteroidota bacterium]
MKYQLPLLISLIIGLLACTSPRSDSDSLTATSAEYAIAIHGGAGTILKENITDEQELAYRQALGEALDIGERILQKGGDAIDAVEQTIHFMEDSPLFNAGKGAVYTHDLKNELDASIMRGYDQNAGAVGGLSTVRYPISAARAVLEHSDHVLLTGAGAEEFARNQELEIVDPSYFRTERRWRSINRIRDQERTELSESPEDPLDKKMGTVGCVALDKSGNIVAGTSTGGMTNKRYNRFGDVP